MATTKKIWVCLACGHEETKWAGSCPGCRGWNTLEEAPERLISKIARRVSPGLETEMSKPVRLKEVSGEKRARLQTGIGEFDRLLGGGLIAGSLTLVGGDPGIGKSTLLLQCSEGLGKGGNVVLYVTGEESLAQTSLRSERLGIQCEELFLLAETNVAEIITHVGKLKPDVLIIDSIQIMYKPEIASAPGSVVQVREIATDFLHLSKRKGITTFLIGHVTKSGELAGPRVLEHLVDTVLYFEGDKNLHFRMVRAVKNRFGSTDEIAVFQMGSSGLTEVLSPSEIFLQERSKGANGSVIIPTIEGSRAILVEVQALVAATIFATPARRSAGIDQNRLALLLAVLEKKAGYLLHQRDVFVSLAGGLKVLEPSIDLGILLAIVSSFLNRRVDPETIVVGEVGLGGEIRSVPRLDSRLKEAVHMGFKRALVPAKNLKSLPPEILSKIQVIGVEMLEEAIDAALS